MQLQLRAACWLRYGTPAYIVQQQQDDGQLWIAMTDMRQQQQEVHCCFAGCCCLP
jgi:hypothetical protein